MIFFAAADVLSGLFALANYDRSDANGVISPNGSGCSTIVNYPYWEVQSDTPRCVLGMFDVTARTQVPGDCPDLYHPDEALRANGRKHG